MLRIALRIGTGLIAVAGILAIAAYGLYTVYTFTPPRPGYAKPASLAEAQRDDLDYLRKLPRADWSYTDETRAQAEQLIDASLKRKFPLKPAALELVVARVAALAGNGHTNVWNAPRANRMNRLPVRLYSFADGVFIVRALPSEKDLLGAQVIAVDGHSVADVAKTLSIYTGGTAEAKNLRLPFYLESPQLLRAAGIANTNDSVVFTLRLPDGTTQTRLLMALDPDTKAAEIWPQAQLRPIVNPGQSPLWLAALKGKADHLLMFQDQPKPFFDRAIPEHDAYYIRFDVNHDVPGTNITDYAKGAFARAVAAKPALVIVDLRMNGGGDYTTTADFMRNLPKALPMARFFILTSQETFSAGMSSAAFLKQAAGVRGIFVGSVVGDGMRFNAEGGDFCLPFSGICAGVRTAIHDYSENPCTPLFVCYPLDWLYPVQIRSFGPDVAAPLTYHALSTGHDPALDAIFADPTHGTATIDRRAGSG